MRTAKVFGVVAVIAVLIAGYFLLVLNWNYSSGERAGWVQKFSNKGWLCKTWEGEIVMVSMPGAPPEKFAFTVWDEAVAEKVNAVVGKRVSLHYEQKVGLPTSCFGDTRYYITAVDVVSDIPLFPGVAMPTQPQPQPPSTP